MIRLFALSFFFLLIGASHAQNGENTKPKLLIGIVVDQLRYDYLDKFSADFGSDGFNRLIQKGLYARNVNYTYKPTYTGPGHATIFTGATPSIHGIVGNNWYSSKEKSRVYCVRTQKKGNESFYSPERMQVQTLADEIRLFNNFKAKAYGVSLKDRGAILPAGHLANGAYWFDGKSGKWISSEYYEENSPQWLSDFNAQDLQKVYLNQNWSLLAPHEVYQHSINDTNRYEGELFAGSGVSFPYDLKKGFEQKGFDLLKTIPQGNSMTVDLAIKLIEANHLGQREVLDFLSVSFSATDYVGHRFGVNSKEVQDTYLRLDRELARLLDFLDEEVGENNYLLFLTSDHGAGEVPQYLKNQGVSAGYMDASAIKGEIDRNLDQKYGEADWILDFINYNFYFNHEAFHDKMLDLKTIYDEITADLLKVEGVADVYHNYRKVSNPHLQQMIDHGVYAPSSGDLILLEAPNYVINSKTGSTHGSPYRYDTHVPLLFYGNGIKSGETNHPYAITDLVPTLSSLLNLPFPDGAFGNPIQKLVE